MSVSKLSKPATSDTFYLTGPCPLNLSKQHHEPGNKCSNTWASGGHFHSNHCMVNFRFLLSPSLLPLNFWASLPLAGTLSLSCSPSPLSWSCLGASLSILRADRTICSHYDLWESSHVVAFGVLLRCCCCCYRCSICSHHWVISSVRTGIVGFVLYYTPSTSYVRAEKWKEWRNELYTSSLHTVFQRLLEAQQNLTQRTHLNCMGLAEYCTHACHLSFQEANAERSWVQGQSLGKQTTTKSQTPFPSCSPKTRVPM